MTVGAGTGGPEVYPTAIAGLWSGLSATLARLDEFAADPDAHLEDATEVESLPALQYALHAAREAVIGIEPPGGSESEHEELVSALAEARDLTAYLHEAVEAEGPALARLLVYEWRGALFRVRFARMRLDGGTAPTPGAEPEEGRPRLIGALAAVSLLIGGTAALVTGAVLSVWALWAAGLVLVAGACAASAGFERRLRR